MRKLVSIIGVLILGLSLIATACAPKAEGPTAAEFYKGSKVDFTVSATPGGSYDYFGRLIAPYLEKNTGATMVITNRGGGASMEGFGYVYRANPDGMSIGTGGLLTMNSNKVFGEPGAEAYEPDKFSHIGSIGQEKYVFFVGVDSPYKSASDLQAAGKLTLGGASARGALALATMISAYLLDLDAKVATGYKGLAPVQLAVQQGEVAGAASAMSNVARARDAGQLRPLFVVSGERTSALPDVPAITELVKLTGEKEKVLQFWDRLFNSWVLFTSPGVPADRVEFLRKAFDSMLTDAEFRQQLDVTLGYKVAEEDIFTGEETTKVAQDVMNDKDQIKQALEGLIEHYQA